MIERQTARLLAVVNPCTLRGRRGEAWATMLRRLRQSGSVHCLDTVGDGRDDDRITEALRAATPTVVISAGGDGTLRAVAAAVLASDGAAMPAVAIAPLGTGNNVARGLGLESIRRGRGAVDLALDAMTAGATRCIDIGRVGDQVFVGSFAVGMDGAILALRNRWRARWQFRRGGGYPLYLLSCAANLTRNRSVQMHLVADGTAKDGALYNLVITNTPVYAGEFRFAGGGDHSDDGRLDLSLFGSRGEYLHGFVTAWRRHVNHTRGGSITARPGARRVARVEIALDRRLPAQLDGEEYPARDRYVIEVVPAALRVLVPPREGRGPARAETPR